MDTQTLEGADICQVVETEVAQPINHRLKELDRYKLTLSDLRPESCAVPRFRMHNYLSNPSTIGASAILVLVTT